MGPKRRGVVCVSVDDGEGHAVYLDGELVMHTNCTGEEYAVVCSDGEPLMGMDCTPLEMAARLAGILDVDLVVRDVTSGVDLPKPWGWEDLAAYVRKNWGRILAEGRPGPEDVVMQAGGATA